ncbi:glycoprotein [Anaeramoeba ignava]|uniref:Glycoprotein n=1 Tax=Anaeramoeba ignava TaxID=1746090 RepID=A0A9Q0RDI6_ANAIG|nr:glycoprotein [Anaeramoeba ignava]
METFNYFLLINLLLVFVFSKDCSNYLSKDDCINGNDQCDCGWYSCLFNGQIYTGYEWCLKGNENGVSSSVNPDTYLCPINSDGFNYFYNCDKGISNLGIGMIVVGCLIFVFVVVFIVIYIRKRRKTSKYMEIKTN